MKAAHIVPDKLGGLTMRLLFGKDDESREYTMRNGLLLHPTVESFFNNGSITIVPASDSSDETELVVRVLEQDEKWLDRDFDRLPLSQDPGHVIKNRDLHERRLVFANASRPAKRFLYFKYCIALYKAQIEKRQAGLHLEIARSRRVWATTGVMMRKNMLRALAATLGHGLASLLHVEANGAAGDPAESRAEKVQAYNELWKGTEDLLRDVNRVLLTRPSFSISHCWIHIPSPNLLLAETPATESAANDPTIFQSGVKNPTALLDALFVA